MRAITLSDEPEEVDASRLRPGDVLFVPLIGKRLVAAQDGGDFFLDYPKRPRVVGNPAPEEGVRLVEASEERYLGWFTLTGYWTVIGSSELIEGEPLVAEPAPQAHEDEDELRALLDRLLNVTNNLDAIANRTGGRPINEDFTEAMRTLRSIDAGAHGLADSDRASDFRELVQTVRKAADQLAIDVRAGVPASAARQMIGAVQAYDDDF